MATVVGRIEREFYLKIMFDEKVPLNYVKDREKYVLTLVQPATNELVLQLNKNHGKLKPNSKLVLIFNYRGQTIDFTTEIISVKDEIIICKTPEKLHKNLDRAYLRIDTPQDINVLFTFGGDRYNLSFPKVMEYEDVSEESLFNEGGTKNLAELVKQFTESLKNFADGYKIINFKDKKPEALEEQIVSETGKALFIPSTKGQFPATDPYPKKRIITEEIFNRFLESNGVSHSFFEENRIRFLRKKYEEGIYSDAWIPILFQEYVVGYIHVWINKQERHPFDYSMLDSIYQFSKVLAFALKENGYFENGKIANETFDGKVLDISASGLLFACPLGAHLTSTLLIDSEIQVSIETSKRAVNVKAKIVRRFKDRAAIFFGCRFADMEPEDTRFLFEHLYGRQIDDTDASFLSGQV